MEETNPVFKKNYNSYLNQLHMPDVLTQSSALGVTMSKDEKAVTIPFLNNTYHVSKSGVMDSQGRRPDYATCVILLKYLLMDRQPVSAGREWIPFREFQDAGQGQSSGLSDYSVSMIAQTFSGRMDRLEAAVKLLDGVPPDQHFPYDLSAVVSALPQIPVLFLFNDADTTLPATAFILYERRAAYYLDAECRVMVDWCIFRSLKRAIV